MAKYTMNIREKRRKKNEYQKIDRGREKEENE